MANKYQCHTSTLLFDLLYPISLCNMCPIIFLEVLQMVGFGLSQFLKFHLGGQRFHNKSDSSMH